MYIPILVALVAGGLLGFFYRRHQLRRESERIHISVPELQERIARKEPLTIIDLRHPLDVLASPQLIPGAMPISPQDIDNRVSDISRNASVVLYCTCPNEETSLKASRQMKDRGFRHLKVLTGGLPAWKQAHLPLQDLYPELEQQVRQRAHAS